jgi:hypothetical protein
VEVTVLGGADAPLPNAERLEKGHVLNISGKGMRILVDRPLPSGTLLEVNREGTLLLGEVCYCHHLPGGNQFTVGLQVEHSLSNTIEMALLAHRLLGIERQPVSRELP